MHMLLSLFPVLHVIKTSQAQHGGRYGDYQRYRWVNAVILHMDEGIRVRVDIDAFSAYYRYIAQASR